MLLLATRRIVLVVSRCCHLLWLSSACWYGDLILVESREVAYRRFGWLPCYHKKLKCQDLWSSGTEYFMHVRVHDTDFLRVLYYHRCGPCSLAPLYSLYSVVVFDALLDHRSRWQRP